MLSTLGKALCLFDQREYLVKGCKSNSLSSPKDAAVRPAKKLSTVTEPKMILTSNPGNATSNGKWMPSLQRGYSEVLTRYVPLIIDANSNLI